jgi:hypothetical protein
MEERLDFVFSYWIFVWYLLYSIRIVPYTPRFVLLLGIVQNIILLFFMTKNGSTLSTIAKFIVINIVIKIIPYYTVKDDNITERDIIISILLFFIYCLWLYVNKETLIEKYNKIYISLTQNRDDTPGIRLLNYLLSIVRKLFT